MKVELTYTTQLYVVAFLFTLDFKKVWLIRKEKPDWQKGCLNGIGGKVDKGEHFINAAHRELKEESGVHFKNYSDLNCVGHMEGVNNDQNDFKVYVFTGVTSEILKTQEKEQIILIDVDKIKNFKHIENVPMLIETCMYYLRGSSNFSKLIMKY